MDISFSRLNMLWRCGEQYRRRYVKNEIIPPGINLIVGSATHDSIEKNLQNKIDKKELLTADVVADIARDGVTARIDNQEIKLSEEEQSAGLTATKGTAVDTAVGLSRLHHGQLAPIIEPVTIEDPFKLKISGTEHIINGRIDIVEPAAIRDTKTTSMVRSGAADQSLQLTMYGLAKLTSGQEIKSYKIDNLVKTKVPKVVTLETTRTKADFEMLLRRIANGVKQIDAGIFPPSNPENWWCSKKWCGFHDSCPYMVNKEII